MAQVLTVKPEFVNTTKVFIGGTLTLLNNDLTQEQLLAIWQKQEFRNFIDITYTNVADSFPESYVVDPNLFHAYDSGEVTHDPTKTNYPAGTVGKTLNEMKVGVDSLQGKPATRPVLLLDFANSRFLDPLFTFTRNSVGTYIDRNGYIKTAQANKPRFTHDPVTLEALGLLLEESRANLLTYSTDLSSNTFTKSGLSIVSGEVSPTGTTDGFLLTDNAVGQESYINKAVTIVDTTVHTYSVFVKPYTIGSNFKIQVTSSSSGVFATFNLLTGSKVSGNAFGTGFTFVGSKITRYRNGWYRCEVSFTANVLNLSVQIIPVVGIHTAAAEKMAIFGPQLAKGDESSSYIPTAATTVTREQDSIAITGNSYTQLFGQVTTGTIIVTGVIGKISNANGKYVMFTGNATAGGSNRLGVMVENNAVKGFIVSDGLSQYEDVVANANPNFTIGFAFTGNSAISAVNGVLGIKDTTVTVPALSEFRVGFDYSPNTTIKSIMFYPEYLSDNELKIITATSGLSGKNASQIPAVEDLHRGAFVSPDAILRSLGKQEFSVDGTGASVTRNIRRPYDFGFEVVDSSGATAITATPSVSCSANTDNALTFTAPVGKTLTYAITPVL